MRATLRERITRIAYQDLIKHYQESGVNGKRKKSFHHSFLTLGNKIVCHSRNNENKSHPICKRYNYYGERRHAELNCVLKFPYPPRELRKAELWSLRINRAGKLCTSRPCEHCMDFLSEFDFRNIFYTNEKGNWCLL